MSAWRRVAGLVVLGLAVWALALVFGAPEPEAAPTAWHSSRQCRDCHAQVYAEWEASWHSRSWTDSEVRALSNEFSNKDCVDCHAPRPVFETGIGQRVLPRAVRQIEGVDCIACHLLTTGEDAGRVAGTLSDKSAACRPVARTELVSPEFCAGCHDQHGTVQQWLASRFAAPGPGRRDCVDCHMPPRDAKSGAGRDHAMHGGHSLELLRAAVELRAVRVEGGWRIEVENVGAGHNFPTDERSRAADLLWRPIGAGPEPGGEAAEKWRHLHRFRNPYRHEIGLPDTELPAGETFATVLEDDTLPAGPDGGAAAVEVGLFYKLSPYFVDPLYDLSPYYRDFRNAERREDAVLVHRLTLEP